MKTGLFFSDQYSYSIELSVEEINKILSDDYVKSKCNIRASNSLDFPYLITHPNQEIQKYIEEKIFTKFSNKISDYVINLLAYGAGALEFVWEKNTENDLYLKDLLFHKIGIENDIQLKNGKLYHEDKLINTENKFIWKTLNTSASKPQGNSIFTKNTYNLCVFRKRIIALLDQLLEKFGVPSIAALLDDVRNVDEAKEYIKILSQEIEKIRSASGIAVANVKALEVLETSGSALDFEKAKKIAEDTLSGLILGSSRTTDSQSKGSYSADKITEDQIFRNAKSDNRLIEEISNDIFNIVTPVLFGKYKIPKIKFNRKKKYSFEYMLKALMAGVPISDTEFRKYVPAPANAKDVLQIEKSGSQGMQFADYFSKKKLPKLKI